MISTMRERMEAKLGNSNNNAFRTRRLFKMYDKEGTGRVHFEDFRNMCEAFGMQLDDDSLMALYYVYDPEVGGRRAAGRGGGAEGQGVQGAGRGGGGRGRAWRRGRQRSRQGEGGVGGRGARPPAMSPLPPAPRTPTPYPPLAPLPPTVFPSARALGTWSTRPL